MSSGIGRLATLSSAPSSSFIRAWEVLSLHSLPSPQGYLAAFSRHKQSCRTGVMHTGNHPTGTAIAWLGVRAQNGYGLVLIVQWICCPNHEQLPHKTVKKDTCRLQDSPLHQTVVNSSCRCTLLRSRLSSW